MEALLFLALITACSGAGARTYREVREPQQFVEAATYPPRRAFGKSISTERSLRTRSRVFRNVQVSVDDEPRLYRASGRFQKRVVAAAPIHDVAAVTVAKDAPPTAPIAPLSYDETNHHLNKMTEDNKIIEEAAEYAKGLERTTVAVRGDQNVIYTTLAPTINPQNVPAIIKPRPPIEEKKLLVKQPPPAFPQPPLGRPQQNVFTVTAPAQTTPVIPGFGANSVIATPPNLLQGPPYQQPALGQVSVPPPIPLSLQPPQNPQVLPGLVTAQLPPQIPPGIPQVPGAPPIPGALNPTPQLGAVPQITPAAQFPQGHHGQGAAVQGQQHLGAGAQPTQTPSLAPQPALPGQVPQPQVPQLTLPTQGAPPPPAFPERVEIINAQAANSSLEQLGCGFDWLTNSCKDVFAIGWCGQCHDFGNIFVHDCKCVRPLIALPPRQQQQQPPRQTFFSMI
ncbi:hypothetical protein Y032_0001g449 [Ancylostoma ceylanicum]|uniref:Uncharacterized protein n=1 Tax=Ancylostoma ceylanicum TaxID=53326 RepID=A0A016W4L1_9BILA|nr:hypothetical protein Y032_0001g449 [Ancylostoma ceylanicum]